MSSYNYKHKNDFDDMHIKHQTKSQFKNNTFTDKDRQKGMRSSFIDCFTNDSFINPITKCPPGVHCGKNLSQFTDGFHCPPGLHYSTETYKCEQFGNMPQPWAVPIPNQKKIEQITNRMLLAKNRKSAFFNSIVE